MSPHKYSSVILGFVEPLPPDGLNPHAFPSKAGGLPLWLYGAPCEPPSPPRCAVCMQSQRYLAQVYAPLTRDVTGHDCAFHRVLYVSVCMSPACEGRGAAAVLRAQLPRTNDFYAFDGGGRGNVEVGGDVCALCGFGGRKRCGKCREVMYCGRGCQATDWKLGHQAVCEKGEGEDFEALREARERWRFGEVEIVTEDHPTPDSSDAESENEESEAGVEQELKDDGQTKFNSTVGATDGGVATSDEQNTAVPVENAELRGTFQDADDEELPSELFRARDGRQRDATFRHFSKVCSYAPDQVIRYDRQGGVLWAAKRVGEDPLPCARCGGPRAFELQLMPQLVYLLERARGGGEAPKLSMSRVAQRLRDDAEWGTIAVFTCARSCVLAVGEYAAEEAVVQRVGTR